MDDLISRQAAIDALMSWVEEHKDDAFGGCLFHWTGIKALLENLPSAQPEIVRCKDCFHYTLMPNGCNGQCDFQHTQVMYPWDFCSYGERRQDE